MAASAKVKSLDEGKSPEVLYREKVRRVLDVAALRVPDRVPVFGPYEGFPYNYSGVSLKDAMNDFALARRVCHKFLDDFGPDLDFGPILAYPAKAMEILGLKWFRWPGHGLGDNVMYQFIEGEYMKAEEYDEFIRDPSHFMISKWLPRSFKGLEGLAAFPPMRDTMWFGWTGLLAGFASPQVQESLRVAREGGEELGRWFGSIGQYAAEIKAKGTPQAFAAFDWPPFDIIGDTLRGTRGILGDMLRRPAKLLEALELATQVFIEYGQGAAGAELPFCWIWMHKGSGGFMSDEQFRTFYWPCLRKGMMALIEKGIIPVVYCEGDDQSRLEYFADVPPGKVIYHFATMDMARAKSVLRGIAAISGNVPNRMLLTATPGEVREYCRKLIEVCGKDGGYILDTSALLDEAKPENVRAMFDAAREFGVY
jgi:hypothetical protein